MRADDDLINAGHHGEHGRVCDEGSFDVRLSQTDRQLLAVVERGALRHDHLKRTLLGRVLKNTTFTRWSSRKGLVRGPKVGLLAIDFLR